MTFAGKTVLITGATGFLGGALARRLASEGASVRALARRPERDRYIRDIPNITVVSGDIADLPRLREVVAGCHYVFHAAAALAGTLDYQREVNVEGTRNVVRAAAEAGVWRLVHVSSIAVYGFEYRGAVTEDLPLHPRRDPYNISKAEAEQALIEMARRAGLSYTIIRPGMIYGPRSGMWTRQMFRLARRSPTVFIGDGSGSTHPIYIDDVVDLLIRTAQHPAAHNQAFNCAPDPAPTWRAFLGAYAQLAGHSGWFGLPVWFARPVAYLLEFALRLRGQPKDLPDLLPYSQSQVTYRMTKACELLGWQARTDLHTGIQNCVPYLREKGLLR